MVTSVAEPEPTAKAPKLNCLPEPKLRIAAPALFYLPQTWRKLYKKIMVAKEVFVNCYNFNPIKKVIFKVSYKTLWSRGRRRSRSRKKYFRLRNTGDLLSYVCNRGLQCGFKLRLIDNFLTIFRFFQYLHSKFAKSAIMNLNSPPPPKKIKYRGIKKRGILCWFQICWYGL